MTTPDSLKGLAERLRDEAENEATMETFTASDNQLGIRARPRPTELLREAAAAILALSDERDRLAMWREEASERMALLLDERDEALTWRDLGRSYAALGGDAYAAENYRIRAENARLRAVVEAARADVKDHEYETFEASDGLKAIRRRPLAAALAALDVGEQT